MAGADHTTAVTNKHAILVCIYTVPIFFFLLIQGSSGKSAAADLCLACWDVSISNQVLRQSWSVQVCVSSRRLM